MLLCLTELWEALLCVVEQRGTERAAVNSIPGQVSGHFSQSAKGGYNDQVLRAHGAGNLSLFRMDLLGPLKPI